MKNLNLENQILTRNVYITLSINKLKNLKKKNILNLIKLFIFLLMKNLKII